ncbi:MAG: type II toxin-antitoxin system VapC family toxin [Anaerolinea sp.]|nr:type II toxin-antitoxin system VapC family toxin [Anaerolinea sp.]
MKLLLDTHAFIWWYNEPQRLPTKVLLACQDIENTLSLSVAAIWEMQIKAQLGKLNLTRPLSDIIYRQQERNLLQILPITLPVVLALEGMPLHHRDPFDRLIIAQAQIDQLLLVSNDSQFKQYDVALFWE